TEPADLAAAAARVAQAARATRPAVRVSAHGVAPPALCDPELIERVLTPIVDNALRHARSAVTLAVGPGSEGGAQVAVIDDGSGFPSEEVDAVFDPGYRGVGAVGNGTGLGLPLSRRLARLAGGDVRVVPGTQGWVVVTFPAGSPDV
ncbi:MAG: sensor histidine kinase, partial [Frankia sp.]